MKQQIIEAITAGLAAGGDSTDWDAPEFESARNLTGIAGCVWDFDSWRDAADCVEWYGKLGGVVLVE